MIARQIPSSGLTLASPDAARALSSAWDARRRAPVAESCAGGWLLIPQPDHAALSGRFAEHWGNALFSPPLEREEVTRAIAHHDDGWAERDAVPRFLPPTGGPQNFLDLEPENFAAISRRSIDLALERSPLSGYMVSWHFLKLAEARSDIDADFAGLPVIQAFIAEQRALEADWRKLFEALPDEATIEACRLLQFTDMLSICVCLGALDPTTFPQEFRTRAGARVKISLRYEPDVGIVLAPYPFDRSPLRFEVPGRRLRQPTFAAQEELARGYNEATEEILSLELRAETQSTG